MREKEMPFWEEAYQNMDSIAFSDEPNSTIKEMEHLFNKKWNVLEVGCGEGQNVLYLAKQGYTNIDAFDLSEHGIAKLRRKCELEGLYINAFVGDLTKYEFSKMFDLVMSFGTLHFVVKEDWEVLQFKSYVFEDEHPGVPKHLHAANKIVVRRKS